MNRSSHERFALRHRPRTHVHGWRCTALVVAIAMSAVVLDGCAALRPAAKEIVVEHDVLYVQRGDVPLRADVYRPAEPGTFPGVLLVHGGSWQRGNKQRMAGIAERLARRGYVAVSIDYRLAPTHVFPAQLHDCQAAVRWMRANAARLCLDGGRIGGFGYSAGGHLVGLLATVDPDDGLAEVVSPPPADTRLQAAVLGAAPVDLTRFPDNRVFRRLLGAGAAERPDLYSQASPITFVSADDPPMFLYHGANDWLVDAEQSRLMIEALQRVAVPATLHEGSGGHFSTFLFDDAVVSDAIDFLDKRL